MTLEQAKDKISDILQNIAHANQIEAESTITDDLKSGKFYEAWVLANLLEKLKNEEGYYFVLTNSNKIEFKSGRGPINRKYPYISVYEDKTCKVLVGEIWTDVEFMGESAKSRGLSHPEDASDKHELDLLFCKPESNLYPFPTDIFLGVECKITQDAPKHMLKSILGVRRELGYKNGSYLTVFKKWPRTQISMDPQVCLLFYSQDKNTDRDYMFPERSKWQSAEDYFDIDFKYLPF